MPKAEIHKIKIRHLRPLREQFVKAAHSSFAYLPNNELDRVINDNNLVHLGVSWAHPKRIMLGLSKRKKLCGYAIGSFDGHGTASLFWLYVDPDIRGRGEGYLLLRSFVEQVRKRGCRRLTLSTHTHQNYYKKHGFETIKKEVLHGVPMDIMKLRINGQA